MKILGRLITILFLVIAAQGSFAAGKAKHVVVLVWDGMRPDFVTEENSPTLFRLSREGVAFKNHHPVYVSTTEVNGTALATGAYPGRSGIVGNREFRPAISETNHFATESFTAIRKGDSVSENHYLAMPTVAELLRQHGKTTAIAGAKGVALLHDRAEREEDACCATVYEGKVLPARLGDVMNEAYGKFPSASTNRDEWTTSVLIGSLWQKGVPDFSLLWLSEPDATQHRTGPGSQESLAAIRSSDEKLSRVLAALEQRGVRDQTDVIVVSDHAFSTIAGSNNVAAVLRTHGIPALREVPAGGLQRDDVLIVLNGGSVFFYVNGSGAAQIEKIVRVLQAQSFCGVVFTRKPVSGAFRLEDVKLDAPTAPDIVMSFRWTTEKNAHGVAGKIQTDGGRLNAGAHGALSPSDMHNTCIAAGPDFKRGVQSFLPSGNVDIAPTILSILGVKPRIKQSGRVLSEAFAGEKPTAISIKPSRIEAVYRGENFTWRQYLNFSEVNGVVYFDEGNGEQLPPPEK